MTDKQPCTVDPKLLSKLLTKMPEQSKAETSSVLMAKPQKVEIADILANTKNSSKSFTDSMLLNNVVNFELPNIEPSKNPNPENTVVPQLSLKFNNKDEEIATRIEFNTHKITFLRAQYELLDNYLNDMFINFDSVENRINAKKKLGIDYDRVLSHNNTREIAPEDPACKLDLEAYRRPIHLFVDNIDTILFKSQICYKLLKANEKR